MCWLKTDFFHAGVGEDCFSLETNTEGLHVAFLIV